MGRDGTVEEDEGGDGSLLEPQSMLVHDLRVLRSTGQLALSAEDFESEAWSTGHWSAEDDDELEGAEWFTGHSAICIRDWWRECFVLYVAQLSRSIPASQRRYVSVGKVKQIQARSFGELRRLIY